MKKTLRFLLAWFVSLCVIWAPVAAYAQVSYSANGGRVIAPALNTLAGSAGFERFMRNVTGTALDIVDRTTGKIGPKSFPVDLTRNLTKGGLLTSAARGAAALASGTAAMVFLPVAAGAAWCKYSTGSWLCDPGSSPISGMCWRVNSWPANQCYSSSGTAITVYQEGILSAYKYTRNVTWNVQQLPNGPPGDYYYNVQGSFQVSSDGTNWSNQTSAANIARYSSTYCQDWIDENGITHPGVRNSFNLCRTGVMGSASEQTVIDRLAPSVSDGAKVEQLARDLLGTGVDLTPQASPGVLTGPSTVQGPAKTTTRTKADGTTETITEGTRYDITYAGDTFSYTTNITTINEGTGETTTETKEDDVAPASDPAMPPQPDLYDQKYPEGLAGVWNHASAALHATPIFTFLASLVPSFGDGGCPTWSIPIMTGWKQYSTGDISIPCTVWSAIRGIVVCTALLTCRKIIFGG